MAAKVHPIYCTFRGGEVSPRSLARVDLELRNQSLVSLENMITQVQGGVFRRPPTIYVANTRYPTLFCRLLPFETPLLVPYVVEMGAQYFRFFRDGKPVCVQDGLDEISNGTFDADLTDWDDLSTGTGVISWNAGGYMNLAPGTGPGWGEQDFATTPGTRYRVQFEVLTLPVKLRIGTATGAEDVLSDLEFTVGNRCFDFVAASATTFLQFRRTTGGSGGVDSVACYSVIPYELASPYLEADLPDIDTRMTPNGMYFFHRLYAPRILTVVADDNWSLDLWDYLKGPCLIRSGITEADWQMTITGTSGPQTMECIQPVFFPGHVGSLWRLKTHSDHRYSVRITGYTSPTEVSVTPIETLDSTDIHNWREGCWSDYRGWPRTGAFFEDRLVVAATTYEPQALWGSQSPDPENVVERWKNFKGENAVLDSDMFYFTLNGNALGSDVIQMLGVLDPLVVLTAAGEITFAGIQQGSVTPTAVSIKARTTYGSAPRTPVRIGNALIFLDKTTRKLRTLSYNWEQEGYGSIDLNFWSEHITEGGIACFVHMKAEVPTLWAARNDGVLLCSTIDAGQDMVAWGRHLLGGTDVAVESLAVSERAVGDETMEYKTSATYYRIPSRLRFFLREVKHSAGGGNVPNTAWGISAGTNIAMASLSGVGHAAPIGLGFMFINLPIAGIDGKKIQVSWKHESFNEGGPADPGIASYLQIYEGSYDRTNDADFPEDTGTTNPLIKGTGLLQTVFSTAPTGGIFVDTAVVAVDLSTASGDYDDCCLMFKLVDGLADRGYTLTVDWIKIFESDGVTLVLMEDFTAPSAITMERDATDKDYGHTTCIGEVEAVTPQTQTWAVDKLRNELWMVVKRTVNGSEVRYIERMDKQLPDSYSDCLKRWSGLAHITTMVGLFHLIGESIEVMVDGVYQGLKIVDANGMISLNPGGEEVIAGFASLPEVETVPPEVQAPGGTVQGKTKRWAYASAYLYETPTCFINGVAVTADVSDWAKILNLGWSKDNRIRITQTGPLPLNILAISGDLEVTQ